MGSSLMILLMGLVFSLHGFVVSKTFPEITEEHDTTLMKKEVHGEYEKKTLTFNNLIGAGHKYIDDLYHTHFDENGTRKVQGGDMADIVHSYVGEVTEKSDVVHFNLSGAHAEEFIEKAEIRLKLPKNPVQWPRGSHSRVLTLYDVTTQKQASHAVHLDANQQWAVFPVQSLVKRWLRFPQTNHGVQLRLTENRKSNRFESTENVTRGLRQRPLQLVIFADDKTPQKTDTTFKSRTRRNSEPTSGRNQTDRCSRRDMLVNTKKMFGDWVLAPAWYNAYKCEGSCPNHPLKESSIFTNHAITQYNIRQLTENKSRTNFCCVPSKYNSLGFLYHHKTRNHLIMRQLQDMIALECLCNVVETSQQFSNRKKSDLQSESQPLVPSKDSVAVVYARRVVKQRKPI